MSAGWGDGSGVRAPLGLLQPAEAEVALQDDDVLMLWNREGRQAIALDLLDFVNVDFESWFAPFANAAYPVAPDPGPQDSDS